jgi:hypothetical protein
MATYRYFGGTSVLSKKLKAFPYTSFKDLFESVLKFPIHVGELTRAEYHKLDKKERDKKKDVPYISPGCYATEKADRGDADIVHCNLLAFDLDDSKDAHPFVAHPELLSLQLDPFNFVAYHSASSTNKNPRVRILVDADSVPRNQYADAVATLAVRLGVKINKESRTPALPMYRPTVFKGESLNPVFAASFDGRPFSTEDVATKFAPGEKPKAREEDPTLDDLDFARSRVDSFDAEQAKVALSFIDPDIVYHEWLSIAAALKHQFGDAGFEIFDEWSSKGKKYEGTEKTEYKWNSYSESPRGRAPVTARSIIMKAHEAGWSVEALIAKEVEETEKRIREASGTRTEMVGACLRWIAKIPILSHTDEETLLNALNAQTNKYFKKKASIVSLRKDLNAIRKADSVKPKVKDELFRWSNDFCYVSAVEKFVRVTTMENFSSESLDATFSELLLPTRDEKEKRELTVLLPEVQPRSYLLNNCGIPRVYDFRYDPKFEDKRFIDEDESGDNRRYLNTYIPSYPSVRGSEHLADYCGELIETHLANLVQESEYRRTLMDWLAFNVQKPGHKIRWAPLIQGAPGCGKTFFANALQSVLGQDNVNVVEAGALGQSWNEWAIGYQVVALEEVRIAGHNRYEILNRLKPLITNDVISVSQRFRDQRKERNISNYLFFTNFHDALPVDDTDRRHFVLKTQIQTKEQVKALGGNSDKYFDELFGMLENHPGGLREFFLQYRISRGFKPNGNAPHTRYHVELSENTAPDCKAYFRGVVKDGTDPRISSDIVSSKALSDHFLVESIEMTPRRVGLMLADEGYEKKTRVNYKNDQHYLWVKIGSELYKADDEAVKAEFVDRNEQLDILS